MYFAMFVGTIVWSVHIHMKQTWCRMHYVSASCCGKKHIHAHKSCTAVCNKRNMCIASGAYVHLLFCWPRAHSDHLALHGLLLSTLRQQHAPSGSSGRLCRLKYNRLPSQRSWRRASSRHNQTRARCFRCVRANTGARQPKEWGRTPRKKNEGFRVYSKGKRVASGHFGSLLQGTAVVWIQNNNAGLWWSADCIHTWHIYAQWHIRKDAFTCLYRDIDPSHWAGRPCILSQAFNCRTAKANPSNLCTRIKTHSLIVISVRKTCWFLHIHKNKRFVCVMYTQPCQVA